MLGSQGTQSYIGVAANGLNHLGSSMNQSIPQKANFKEMLHMSQTLDKNIKANLSNTGGKISFF